MLIIEIYFKNRPADITQKLYKKNGLRPFEYWYYELSYILNNDWVCDDQFCNSLSSRYLKDKYGTFISSSSFDSGDRQKLLEAFYKYLGIEKEMFPYNQESIPIMNEINLDR